MLGYAFNTYFTPSAVCSADVTMSEIDDKPKKIMVFMTMCGVHSGLQVFVPPFMKSPCISCSLQHNLHAHLPRDMLRKCYNTMDCIWPASLVKPEGLTGAL